MSLLLAVFLIFSPVLVGLGGLFLWLPHYRAKIGEPPVRERMLRQAGDSLRRKITQLNEALLEDIIVASFAPSLLAIIYFVQQMQHGEMAAPGWWLSAVASGAVMFWKGRSIVRRVTELRNRELGYDGERLVAERLAPLARNGFLIYHDCPADEHGNIDHIVVTPSAVYAIETKTRRKRPVLDAARSPAEVTYDGHTLEYPHGQEDFDLDQARRQALWLSDLLSRALDQTIDVQPVLALPGWMVHRTGRGDVAVVNPKQFPTLMRERFDVPLNSAAARRMRQIEFVLDERCRDVAFGQVDEDE